MIGGALKVVVGGGWVCGFITVAVGGGAMVTVGFGALGDVAGAGAVVPAGRVGVWVVGVRVVVPPPVGIGRVTVGRGAVGCGFGAEAAGLNGS